MQIHPYSLTHTTHTSHPHTLPHTIHRYSNYIYTHTHPHHHPDVPRFFLTHTHHLDIFHHTFALPNRLICSPTQTPSRYTHAPTPSHPYSLMYTLYPETPMLSPNTTQIHLHYKTHTSSRPPPLSLAPSRYTHTRIFLKNT